MLTSEFTADEICVDLTFPYLSFVNGEVYLVRKCLGNVFNTVKLSGTNIGGVFIDINPAHYPRWYGEVTIASHKK